VLRADAAWLHSDLAQKTAGTIYNQLKYPAMTAYFYCCPQRLDVGSFVDPGEWGRVLRTYDHLTFSSTWIILLREIVYELVRREQFPTKPSRRDCLLLCMSEDGVTEFRAASGRRFDYRYEVELVHPQARSHLGDWTLTSIKSTDDIAAIERSASLYWQGAGIAKPELATLSPIWITRRLWRARWRSGRSR
jgi:Protein of unknown function (DUF2441)